MGRGAIGPSQKRGSKLGFGLPSLGTLLDLSVSSTAQAPCSFSQQRDNQVKDFML